MHVFEHQDQVTSQTQACDHSFDGLTDELRRDVRRDVGVRREFRHQSTQCLDGERRARGIPEVTIADGGIQLAEHPTDRSERSAEISQVHALSRCDHDRRPVRCGLDLVEELIDEAGLADAGFTGHECDARDARRACSEHVVHRRQFGRTADHDGARPRGRHRTWSHGSCALRQGRFGSGPHVSLALAQPDRAAQEFRAALRLSADLGHDEGVAYGLEAMAVFAAGSGDAERAGLLLGAAQSIRDQTGLRNSFAVALYGPAVDAIIDSPLADAFRQAQLDGRNLSARSAIALAFDSTDIREG